MEERQWLRSASPTNMLRFLGESKKFSERKLRLFAYACCSRPPELDDSQSSKAANALEVIERSADSKTMQRKLAATRKLAEPYADPPLAEDMFFELTVPAWCWWQAVSQAAWRPGKPLPFHDALSAANWATSASENEKREKVSQARLLRDIIGNPFRPVAVDRNWQSITANKLADAIYAERAFDRLPILADALEDAGCTNTAILKHCRGPGPHVRGCWVVDLILGKS